MSRSTIGSFIYCPLPATQFESDDMKIRSLKQVRGRRGFTLIEIMVVMTIIAILISILVPAIGYVRETARGSQCRASLRQFFIGFTGLADREKAERMSTGSYDPTRDGCPDNVGWVADLVNAKVCKPIELRCPSNPGIGSEKYLDILGTATSSGSGENGPPAKVTSGRCATAVANGTELADHFLAKGYGTNHMTTWFMSRTGLRLRNTTGGTSTSTIETVSASLQKGLNGSKGPLTRRILDQSPHTANTIPLAGDANLGDVKERYMSEDVTGTDGTVYVKNGDLLVETSSDGAYARNPIAKVTADFTVLTQTSSGSTGLVADEQPAKNLQKKGNIERSHLQDYRDFGAVHGGSANILFADGSVKSFQDLNGDGFLNPGFMATSASVAPGYALNDAGVELPEAEIFSGIFLEPIGSSQKTNLD